MPDQSTTDPAATFPAGPQPEPAAQEIPTAPPLEAPPPMDSSDLPPAPPIVEPAPPGIPGGDTGGAAPTFDISSSISGNPPPKKKFGGRKFVATILGLLVLVGGLGAGIILVQQQQDIRERAAGSVTCTIAQAGKCGPEGGCSTGQKCKAGYVGVYYCQEDSTCSTPTPYCTSFNNRDCVYGCEPTTTGGKCKSAPTSAPSVLCPRDCIAPKSKCAPNSFYPTESQSLGYGDCGAALGEYCCNSGATSTPPSTPNEQPGERCDALGGKCVEPEAAANSNCDKLGQQSCPANEVCIKCAGASTPIPTLTPPPGGGVVAQCLNIRAFDTNWTELSVAQLSQLKAGDKVRFAVGGTSSGGSFDKAKFKINGIERPEVTGKRPDSQEYFDEYTIPEGVTTFTINAQIHHSSLGWSN